jgi:3-deoxy-7-phosphoheptulonate synthase
MKDESAPSSRSFALAPGHFLDLTSKQKCFIDSSRQAIKNILSQKDPRKLLIFGPCSIHDPESFLEYAHLFKKLSYVVEDQFYCVLRAYVEKPRSCLGWRGYIQDPFLDESYQIEEGLLRSRKLFSTLTDEALPLACELLDPLIVPFYQDYISWGCIGARTCTSPAHRHLASAMPFAVGFKNGLDGNLEVAIQALISARQSHVQLTARLNKPWSVNKSAGNPFCHLVLRGSQLEPNYSYEWIEKAHQLCIQEQVLSATIIDCAHDNSRKRALQQTVVFEQVIENLLQGNYPVCGLMLESFIHEGHQPISQKLKHGISITDPCLSFQRTEHLVLGAYKKLKSIQVKLCFC